jgi:hypothetical protein
MARQPIDLPLNGVDAPPAPRIIDLTPLLRDLERQIEEGEQEARVIQMKLARIRGQRDGVLMAVEHAQQPPAVVSEGAG